MKILVSIYPLLCKKIKLRKKKPERAKLAPILHYFIKLPFCYSAGFKMDIVRFQEISAFTNKYEPQSDIQKNLSKNYTYQSTFLWNRYSQTRIRLVSRNGQQSRYIPREITGTELPHSQKNNSPGGECLSVINHPFSIPLSDISLGI